MVVVSKKDSSQLIVDNISSPIRYCIMGKPIPLDRPRFSQGHVWDSQKQLKHSWGVQLQAQHKNRPLLSGMPLHLDIEFFMQFPRVTVIKQMQMANRLHLTRPDLSNLIKFAEDAATGVILADDCVIASITAVKRYSDNPRTEFMFIEIPQVEIEKQKQNSKKESDIHIKNCDAHYCDKLYCPNYDENY